VVCVKKFCVPIGAQNFFTEDEFEGGPPPPRSAQAKFLRFNRIPAFFRGFWLKIFPRRFFGAGWHETCLQ
jgi:hypothetical protein